MAALKIDLYTDVECPWCIIGQHRLDKVLAARFPELVVDIEHHPVILMPDGPPEGVRIADLLKSRYGVTDPAASWARPHAEARASGLDLDLGRQPFAYPTLHAHTLIRLARLRGTQHALANAISKAYFMDAQNISDARILADIAVRHGFDFSEVISLLADPHEGMKTERQAARSFEVGVRSVPHFVFGGRMALNGGRSEDELAQAIAAALNAGATARGLSPSLEVNP
jgi:predicted DsbA family dithiol-disulfide isomerase